MQVSPARGAASQFAGILGKLRMTCEPQMLTSGVCGMQGRALGGTRVARAQVVRKAGDRLARRDCKQQEETELRRVERISDVEAELGREQEIGRGEPADE